MADHSKHTPPGEEGAPVGDPRGIRRKGTQVAEEGSGGYPEYDEASFKQMQELASDLQSDYKDRDLMLDDMIQYWSMIWKNPIPQDTNQTAVTYDTDMTNRLMGAYRLLTATEPEFSVPTDLSQIRTVPRD